MQQLFAGFFDVTKKKIVRLIAPQVLSNFQLLTIPGHNIEATFGFGGKFTNGIFCNSFCDINTFETPIPVTFSK